MLKRTEPRRCIECGLPMTDERFQYHYGRFEHGPAYWSDRGILCSAACSLAHHRKRSADGTLPSVPAPDPFE